MLIAAITAALLLADPGAWIIMDERSAMDGERSYMAGIESREPLRNTAGRPEAALLSLNCVNGRRTVAIIWPSYLGINDAMVRWKFDDGEIQQRSVEVMRGGKNLVLGGRVADRFIDEVAGAQVVVIEVSGYTGQQEAVFDVEGAAEIAAMVRATCAGR